MDTGGAVDQTPARLARSLIGRRKSHLEREELPRAREASRPFPIARLVASYRLSSLTTTNLPVATLQRQTLTSQSFDSEGVFRGVRMSSRLSRTIYVGNLPGDIRKREIEDLFYKYGPIVDIELKIPARPPGYAFVEFEDRRDAEDAIYGRDGYEFDGYRLRVELAHGGQRSPVDRYRSYSGSSSSSRSRRSDYRGIYTLLRYLL